MPVKKTAAKAAKKAKAKPKAKPSPKIKKPATKKTAPKTAPVTVKRVVESVVAPSPPPLSEPKDLVECRHCEGTGKCAAGQPYDKSHHQGIFTNARLTSCVDCLIGAGESHNSKKLVDCRLCHGTGKVEKQ